MAQPVHRHVLVIGDDTRVRAALAALIDATPGLQVAATIGSTADALAIGRYVGATVAVVDVDAGQTEHDFATIRQLAEHLTVIAIGNATAGAIRALQAGATAVCDKNGDPDALTAAVEAAARGRHLARAAGDVRPGKPGSILPKPRTH